MTQLVYSKAELLESHPYVKPHVEAGYTLHGGFTADGAYVSPRTLKRWPAVTAWADALKAKGHDQIYCGEKLLTTPTYPSREQQKLLLRHGLGQTFWNSLTTTGVIEARGGALCNIAVPDFQNLVVEDVSQMLVGHLHKGLLWAHGADEAGDPAHKELGAHDRMWFAARDLVFGKNAYPFPEVAASIARPAAAEREMPQIPMMYEQLIKFMMNVLMIEIRAESFFAFCKDVFTDPENFEGRRAEADLAALMIGRIATDEAIHVGYLQGMVSELRALTLKTENGGTVPGHEVIDPVWARIVAWPSDQAKADQRALTRAAIEQQVIAKLGADRAKPFLAEFDSLSNQGIAA